MAATPWLPKKSKRVSRNQTPLLSSQYITTADLWD